jgi:hypothetical protein
MDRIDAIVRVSMETRRPRFVVVDGVMWCHIHHGIADENCNGNVCDQYNYDDDGEPDCELRTLYFNSDEVVS